MGAIYKCQTNYQCYESFIDFIISIGILYFFITKGKEIYQKNNGILLVFDQVLYTIGITQIALQVIYFLIAQSNLWLIGIRCIGLIIEILICVILLSIMLEKDKHQQLFYYARLSILLVGIFWIYEGILHYHESVYYCNEISNLYMSMIGLALSIATFTIGFQCVHQLHQYKEYLLANKNDSFAHQLLKLEIRIVQINIFRISGLIQFGLQFCWDSLAYFLSETTIQCAIYYQPFNIQTVLMYSLLKIISLSTLPISIFIVCYYCNKEFFEQDSHIWNSSKSQKSLQETLLPNYIEIPELR